MKVVFIGGGSIRLLPIIRAAMAHEKIFGGGEIVLYDLDVARAEAMGRMVMKTPEWHSLGTKVTWGDNLDSALIGADVVNVVLPVGSPEVVRRSCDVSRKHGFMASDQLSPSGAFRSLTGGRLILDFARKMERLCPQAWMVVFANPVAVYSGLVNFHTKIKALGICQGFTNHTWDLPRLMGEEGPRSDFDLEVAGVNHLSYILRGKCGGNDLYETLEPYLTKDWRPPRLPGFSKDRAKRMGLALSKLVEVYRKFGVTIFSSEKDGMCHLFYEEMFEKSNHNFTPRTPAEIKQDINQQRARRSAAERRLQGMMESENDSAFWENEPMVRPAHDHVTVRILKGLAGVGRERIVTSFPNGKAVEGFKERTVLEYSQTFSKGVLKPYGTLSIPDALHGLISCLAGHQTLLGDAIATEDPKILYQALQAYPVKPNSKASRALFKDLLKVHAKEIPAVFQGTREYL